jgi:hypothetical protein
MMMAVYNRVRDHVTEHVWETDYARAVGARGGGVGPGAHAVSFRFPGTKRANYYGESKRKLIRSNPILELRLRSRSRLVAARAAVCVSGRGAENVWRIHM